MLFKAFVGLSILSMGFFTMMAMTGAKGPRFETSGSIFGGRGSTGYHSIWHGGK